MWLGTKDICDVLSFQHSLFVKKLAGDKQNTILTCEHPSVYTYDARIKNQRLWRASRKEKAPLSSIPLLAVERAGGITYHGPGQVVTYCVLDLQDFHIAGPLAWNYCIDETIKTVLESYGVQGRKRSTPRGAQGIWVAGEDHHLRKIASRGVTIRGSITRFGFALNVSPNLSCFDPIYPCGLDIEMTSLLRETSKSIPPQDVAQKICQTITKVLESKRKQKGRSDALPFPILLRKR